ncbi:MAG: hypothetical protein LBM04_03985 [Opitutaceae bacterium]|jgi:hypothetical protein|nr:hypothetical protein [Opitutaceae bacterium]
MGYQALQRAPFSLFSGHVCSQFINIFPSTEKRKTCLLFRFRETRGIGQKGIIQISGKRPGELLLPVGAPWKTALAAARENTGAVPRVAGKPIRNIIHVPGRILNLVMG